MAICRIYIALATCGLLAAVAPAQEIASNPAQPEKTDAASDNPFRPWRLAVEQQALQPKMQGIEYGAGGMVGIAGAYGGEMYGGYAPAGSGEGGYQAAGYGGGTPSPSELFQQAVRISVQRLTQAETDAEKRKVLETVRIAFDERYRQAIAQRQQELDKLEQQLQQLRADLERRRAAQQKVVEVQLRTVELAGEGLVELDAEQ